MLLTSLRTFKKIKNKKKLISSRIFFWGQKTYKNQRNPDFKIKNFLKLFYYKFFFKKLFGFGRPASRRTFFKMYVKKKYEIFDMKKIDI